MINVVDFVIRCYIVFRICGITEPFYIRLLLSVSRYGQEIPITAIVVNYAVC